MTYVYMYISADFDEEFVLEGQKEVCVASVLRGQILRQNQLIYTYIHMSSFFSYTLVFSFSNDDSIQQMFK